MLPKTDKKLDRRTAYTRIVIKTALFDLLAEKQLSKITVKEICERAQINRATFYRNYLDIYDLYEKIETELTTDIFADNKLEQSRYQLLDVIYHHQAFYREFFNSQLESKYIKDTVAGLADQMKTILLKRGSFDEATFELTYQYNYYGVIGVIKEWLNAGCPVGPHEFGDRLFAIVEKQYQE